MKIRLRRCIPASLALLVLAAAPAQAGPLTSVSFQFELGLVSPATFTASGLAGAGSAHGSGATASWSVATGAVPGGTFVGSLPSTAAPPISGEYFQAQGNPVAGSFQAGAGGSMPVTITLDLTSYGGLTLFSIPFVVGTPTTVAPPPAYGISLSAVGTGWTTGATTLALATPTPSGATTAKRTGSNGLVNGAGTVVLVSAVQVSSNFTAFAPSFATLTLHYASVPEPGTALLLAAAALGLAGLGRARRRR